MGEQELQNQQARLAYEVAVYKEQLRLLEREIERINLTTVDLSNAEKTIQNLKNEDILVPVGGGTFIRSSVYTTKALVPVGADYLIEIERDQAIAEIKKRVEATRKAIDRLKEEFERIARRLQESGVKLRDVKTRDALSKKEDEITEAYL